MIFLISKRDYFEVPKSKYKKFCTEKRPLAGKGEIGLN
jgi:hypothetical protein